ncbi:exopolysaccharide production protein ExoY [Roseovarius azorensis]|uniref:Exopolysaccharide production protein ExoY n=1 Tax=Roseovarius azorensis TaxID=1287727 RepID=A0A1H7KND9_9RHOB|nr:sugar transferase [Roseovarius azorensis]SEK88030.1 exopolysaccharide production protein ExoY [Roseovarius azorensis]
MSTSNEASPEVFTRRQTCPGDHERGDARLSTGGVLGGRSKRVLDVLIALIGLILLSPLFLLIACAIKLSSPGPVLFGHTRIGYAGQPFRCWKFRSMVVDGQHLLDRYLAEYPDEHHTWLTERKLKHDPRITRVGWILRTYSVDELPQLLNVLAGSMSLVGPRPVVRDELSLYSDAVQFYLSAHPGITGLWQVSGRSDVGYDTRIELDKSYVQNWSLLLDCAILLRTIPVVIAARGSY